MPQPLVVLVLAALPLAGCASPNARTDDATGRIGDQLVRDVARETTTSLQRALPRTFYRPLDRSLRTTTREVRRGVEDTVLQGPQRRPR